MLEVRGLPAFMSGMTGVARMTRPLTLTTRSVSVTPLFQLSRIIHVVRVPNSPPGFRSLILTVFSVPNGLTL